MFRDRKLALNGPILNTVLHRIATDATTRTHLSHITIPPAWTKVSGEEILRLVTAVDRTEN